MSSSSLLDTQSGTMDLADEYLRERYLSKRLRKKPSDMNMFQWQRERLGITQQKMADLMGIPVYSLRSYEYEARYPRVDVWKRLSDVTHVSVADLLELEDKYR